MNDLLIFDFIINLIEFLEIFDELKRISPEFSYYKSHAAAL